MNLPQWITAVCQVATIGILLKLALPSKPTMKDRLMRAGFTEREDGAMFKDGKRFLITAWKSPQGWLYRWTDKIENCGSDVQRLQNITQILFYL